MAIKGWTEKSALTAFDFCDQLQDLGVGTIIVTDISKDGAMAGTNHRLYRDLMERFSMQIIASGGVSSLEDVQRLAQAGMYGAIIGKAYYTGAIDLKQAIEDGFVAIKGWTEKSALTAFDFCDQLQDLGVGTIIVTDISKDGAMAGTNHRLYRDLMERFSMQIIASGGVSSLEDVQRLAQAGMYGAIIGKAYYTGAIDLKQAIEVAR